MAPSPLSVATSSVYQSSVQPTKPVPSTSATPTRITRASQSRVGTSMIVPSAVPIASSPVEHHRTARTASVQSLAHVNKVSHSGVESPPRCKLPVSPPVESTKSEPSVVASLPPPASNMSRSPFKIRIPRAINTAVAAATAAAAAAGPTSTSTPRSNGFSRSVRRRVSSVSDSSLSSPPFVTRKSRARKGGTSQPNGVGTSGTQRRS